jgi:hypothetical protein
MTVSGRQSMPQRELPEYIFRGAAIICGVAIAWVPLMMTLVAIDFVKTGALGGGVQYRLFRLAWQFALILTTLVVVAWVGFTVWRDFKALGPGRAFVKALIAAIVLAALAALARWSVLWMFGGAKFIDM